MRRAAVSVASFAVSLLGGACFVVSGDWSGATVDASAPSGDDALAGDATGDASVDGPRTDAPSQDAGDSSSGSDGGGDAGDGAVVVTYNDMTKASFWKVFDLATVDHAATGFFGGAFDGRYVYLSPQASGGLVVRYDSQADFSVGASYATYTLTAIDARARSFGGAAFDGHVVYFVPNGNGTPDGVLVRYDPAQPFVTPPSLSLFDVTTVDPIAKGFQGSAFDRDGGILYLAPATNGLIARYHVSAAFDAGGSYDTFDRTSVASQFTGGVFDGRYVYFVPLTSSNVMRYDTQGSFSSPNSYVAYNLSNVGAGAFGGAVFDGRYVYFEPRGIGVAVQFDTQGAFQQNASYTAFDVRTLPATDTFVGAAFDGRYIYFAPATSDTRLIRYDTTLPFNAQLSWARFDLSALSAGAHNYAGIVFDGRYLYLVPNKTGVVARFDARTPPAPPPL